MSREVDAVVAPAGFTCEQTQIGANGGTFVDLVDNKQPQHTVNVAINPGGDGDIEDFACAYIPAAHFADETVRGPDFEPSICTATPGVADTQIPTGRSDLFAALVRFPATIQRPPGLVPPVSPIGDGIDSTVAVFTAQITDGITVDSQEIDCTLPASQLNICTASLSYFLAVQSRLGKQMTLPNLLTAESDMTAALANAPSGTAPTKPEGGEPTCHAAVDLKLQRNIDKYAQLPIHVPTTIRLPANLEGAVEATASLGDVAICKTGVLARLQNPLPPSGVLTIGADLPDGHSAGPFVYSLAHTGWTATPGAPPDQHFTSKFGPPSVTWEINPHLSFDQSGGVDLELASVQLHAVPEEVTLVQQKEALLQASVGPTISLSVVIRKDLVAQNELEAEQEGLDAQTAADDIAEELSYDAVVGVEAEVSEFYGIDINSVAQMWYAQADEALVNALNEDAALANSVTASDPIVAAGAEIPTGADTSAAATTLDSIAADAAPAVEAPSLEELLVLVLF